VLKPKLLPARISHSFLSRSSVLSRIMSKILQQCQVGLRDCWKKAACCPFPPTVWDLAFSLAWSTNCRGLP
jgi:hypothetical protein